MIKRLKTDVTIFPFVSCSRCRNFTKYFQNFENFRLSIYHRGYYKSHPTPISSLFNLSFISFLKCKYGGAFPCLSPNNCS